jgi:hypothetical protein
MLLAQVVDRDHDGRDDLLRKRGVPVENVHEQFQQQEIEQEIAKKGKCVAEELHPAPQARIHKHYILAEQEACQIGVATGHDEGGRVRPEHEKAHIDGLAPQYPKQHHIVQHQPHEGVETATGRIPEGLQGHDSPERRIKKIDDAGDILPGHNKRGAKLRFLRYR